MLRSRTSSDESKPRADALPQSAPSKGGWLQNPTVVIEQKPVARFRVRGWGIKEVDDPAVIKALLEGGQLDNPHTIATLIREGVFVQAGTEPQSVLLHCPLSFTLPSLFPKESKAAPLPRPEQLCLNPDLHWQTRKRVPRALVGRAYNSAPLAPAPRVWVADPSTRILFPYWPDAAVKECLTLLQRGRLLVSELSEVQRRVLFAARILVPRRWIEEPRSAWSERCQALATSLSRNKFLHLKDLFAPLQLAHLRSYFRALEREGYLKRGDTQVERRLFLHREPLSSALHEQLVPLVRAVTGEALQASYSYFGVYLPGAVLERHRDRPQCQWNLSLVWDTRPERARADAWPIHLEVNGRAQQVDLGMGDGLLYRGTEYFHWRDKQPPRNFTAATFFHFVEEGFRGSLD